MSISSTGSVSSVVSMEEEGGGGEAAAATATATAAAATAAMATTLAALLDFFSLYVDAARDADADADADAGVSEAGRARVIPSTLTTEHVLHTGASTILRVLHAFDPSAFTIRALRYGGGGGGGGSAGAGSTSGSSKGSLSGAPVLVDTAVHNLHELVHALEASLARVFVTAEEVEGADATDAAEDAAVEPPILHLDHVHVADIVSGDLDALVDLLSLALVYLVHCDSASDVIHDIMSLSDATQAALMHAINDAEAHVQVMLSTAGGAATASAQPSPRHSSSLDSHHNGLSASASDSATLTPLTPFRSMRPPYRRSASSAAGSASPSPALSDEWMRRREHLRSPHSASRALPRARSPHATTRAGEGGGGGGGGGSTVSVGRTHSEEFVSGRGSTSASASAMEPKFALDFSSIAAEAGATNAAANVTAAANAFGSTASPRVMVTSATESSSAAPSSGIMASPTSNSAHTPRLSPASAAAAVAAAASPSSQLRIQVYSPRSIVSPAARTTPRRSPVDAQAAANTARDRAAAEEESELVASLKQQCATLTAELNVERAEATRLRKELGRCQEQIEVMEQRQNSEIERLVGDALARTEKVHLDMRRAETTKLTRQHRDLESALHDMSATLATYESRNAALQREKQAVEERLEQAQVRVQQLKDELDIAQPQIAQVAQLKARVTRLQDKLEESSDMIAHVAYLEQQSSTQVATIAELQTQLAETASYKAQALKYKEVMMKEQQEAMEARLSAERMSEELQHRQSECADAVQRQQALRAQVKELEEECAELRAAHASGRTRTSMTALPMSLSVLASNDRVKELEMENATLRAQAAAASSAAASSAAGAGANGGQPVLSPRSSPVPADVHAAVAAELEAARSAIDVRDEQLKLSQRRIAQLEIELRGVQSKSKQQAGADGVQEEEKEREQQQQVEEATRAWTVKFGQLQARWRASEKAYLQSLHQHVQLRQQLSASTRTVAKLEREAREREAQHRKESDEEREAWRRERRLMAAAFHQLGAEVQSARLAYLVRAARRGGEDASGGAVGAAIAAAAPEIDATV